jgi:hypothetical protein
MDYWAQLSVASHVYKLSSVLTEIIRLIETSACYMGDTYT